jgi:pantothenate kinase-related protein Tda10
VPLIVVSGAPGTGKSTIAAALGAALRFPVLSLDPIKETLADVLGLGGRYRGAWRDRRGSHGGPFGSTLTAQLAAGAELRWLHCR